jgi:chromosome segregation ATPase
VLVQVIELSQQNTELEEEALSLEQKLGEAESAVDVGQKRLAELSKKLASGADGSKELREKLTQQEVRFGV